ncbi:MAG TPA: helix-turn-helix transcriptional regulator [Acidimicrobiales bacterium]|jgi:transcriptional regulator with XRE-family HTH domain
MVQIGDRVRTIRQENGQTQEALARAADVSNGTIIRVELGRNIPRLDTLRKIAAGLDVPIGDLLEDDDLDDDLAS